MNTLHRAVLTMLTTAVLTACGGGGGSSDSGSATLAAPAISTSPVSQSVNAGGTVTFSVAATGGGTLSYQWQLNGVDIAGATLATYTTSALAASASGGSYRVVVTNGGGSTTSSAATVTVNSALSDSLSTATALAQEASDLMAAAQRKVELPGGVQFAGLPAGVTTTIQCGAGGSFAIDYPSSFTASTQFTGTFDHCQYVAGYMYNGSYTTQYSRFVDANNFSWTATYNITYSSPNNADYIYAGTHSCSYTGGQANCTYNDGTRDFSNSFVYNAGQANGSYSWTYSGVTVSYSCSQWTATSGTITVTSSDGFSATIVRTGANTFTVTIANGSTWAVTL